MYKVKYEKYYNDYKSTQEVKFFYSLNEIANWLFGMIQGKYDYRIHFTNPDTNHMRDGKLHLDNSCIKSDDGNYIYFIEHIEKDDTIIYSCGTFTNGICHWNEEIKQWLRDCRQRKNNPTFNFG